MRELLIEHIYSNKVDIAFFPGKLCIHLSSLLMVWKTTSPASVSSSSESRISLPLHSPSINNPLVLVSK